MSKEYGKEGGVIINVSSMAGKLLLHACFEKKVSLKVKTNKKENSSEYYAQEDYITVF